MQRQKNNRVAIIGCGHIEATGVYSLLLSEAVEELVLIGEGSETLLGEVSDLLQSAPLERVVRMWAGDYEHAQEAQVAVIAATANGSQPCETRLAALGKNIALVREIMRRLKAADFDGVVLMTTNPVDILAQIAQEESGLPFEKVIGSGTPLEAARLKAMLGVPVAIAASAAHEYIAGEQEGDAEAVTWCAARVGGSPLMDFCTPNCPDFDKMLERARDVSPESACSPGYASFAVGSCVTKICEAVLRDERIVLPVSTMTTGQHGISGVYLSLPCVVGQGGAERVIETRLGEDELKGLLDSATLLKHILAELKTEAALSAVK